MRILQVCPRFYPDRGGIEDHVWNISDRLAKKFDVSIFTTDPSGKLPKEEVISGVENTRVGVKIRRFRCFAQDNSYNLSLSLVAAVRRSSADIVHIHGYYDLTPPLIVLLKNRKRCLFTLHSGGSSSSIRRLLHLPYNLTMRSVMRRVDRVICVSKFELEHFREILKLPESKMELVPNGVNLVEFGNKDYVKTIPPTILSVGRLEKYKGQHRVIRSFRVFKNLFPNNGARLCILGAGPYKSKLESEIKRLKLNDSVQFLSWLSRQEYAALLGTSSMLILLSDYESQSILVSEALAVKTPAIVANNSALAEYIEDGSAIGVQNPDYPYEVALKMKLALDDSQCCRFSTRKLASWDDVVQRITNVYCEVLQR